MAAAAGLALLGLAAPFLRVSRFDPWRHAAFVVLLGLGWGGGAESFFSPDETAPVSGLSAPRPPETGPSRLVLDGREYVKINLGELFAKAEAGQGEGDWVVRGFVIRQADKLDPQGELGLFRVSLYCCFADATAVGLIVAGLPVEAFQSGQWIQVHGRLEPRVVSEDVAGLTVNSASTP